MFRIVALTAVICFAAVHAKFTWQCPKIQSDVWLDYLSLKGHWYVYASDDSSVRKCYNYTITDIKNNDYRVNEAYFTSLFHNRVSYDYELVNQVGSPNLSFQTLGSKFFGKKYEWKVITSNYNAYLLLYSCSWFEEHSQIWVRDKALYAESGFPTNMSEDIKKIKFQESDYTLRKASYCNH